MITTELQNRYYKALIEKDPTFLGIFFVGVKTTGIFCAPTCRTRKPKIENTEYFSTIQAARHNPRGSTPMVPEALWIHLPRLPKNGPDKYGYTGTIQG